MYNLNSGATQATPKAKEPELNYIISRLESESSRFYNLVNDLIRKTEFISRMQHEEQCANKPSEEPMDFVCKAHYEINNIARQNDKMEILVKHFETLV